MLTGGFARQGYDWWWHSFSGRSERTGERRAFFIEFFCCNPALAQDEPVFGQVVGDGEEGRQPSYLMVKAGCWGEGAKQLHRFFAWKDVKIGGGSEGNASCERSFHIIADDCVCCETDLIGRVEVSADDAVAHPEWMSDAGSMIWDLKVDKRIAYNVGYGASAPMRATQAFQMFWHVEGMKTAYEGTVVLDGERYVIEPETCFGYADKNWGSDFTSPWVWLSSCDLVSVRTGERLANSAFDIGGGRPKVGPVALDRKLLGCMNYEGRPFEFNFSKPWTAPTTRFKCWETQTTVRWYVDLRTRKARLVVDITCPKSEMLLINYESPDGAKRHNRLWNGGTGTGRVQLFEKHGGVYELVDEMRCASVGCEYGEYGE